jgi:hypothetical protein
MGATISFATAFSIAEGDVAGRWNKMVIFNKRAQ